MILNTHIGAKVEPLNPMTLTALAAGSTVGYSLAGSWGTSRVFPVIEYSTDGGSTWSVMVKDTPITLANIGDSIQLRSSTGDNFAYTSSVYTKITGTGQLKLSGNLLSMQQDFAYHQKFTSYGFMGLFRANTAIVDASEFIPRVQALSKTYSLGYLFYGCTSLVTGCQIPDNYVDPNGLSSVGSCYYDFFYGCSSMTSGPDRLPCKYATKSMYYNMFYNCTALQKAPEIDVEFVEVAANSASAFNGMFYGCAALVEPPSVIKLKILGSSCCSAMFQKCTSLAVAPVWILDDAADVIGGTSVFTSCFNGCTSLVRGALFSHPLTNEMCPSTRSGIFNSMYLGCTGLTTAPNLNVAPGFIAPGTAFQKMFNNCTGITMPPADFGNLGGVDSTGGSIFEAMFSGCSSLREAPNMAFLPATIGTKCCYQMFQNCTSLATAPATLSATTLGTQSYTQMFYGCSALTKGPDIMATSLSTNGMSAMFYGCTSLTSVKIYYTGVFATSTSGTTGNWMNGVNTVGTLYYRGSDRTKGASAIPTNWSVSSF